MLRQVWSLYQRFIRQNLSVTLEGGSIVDPDGRAIGSLDIIRLRDNQVFLRGWTTAPECYWVDGSQKTLLKRRIWREDAPGQANTPFGLGFEGARPGLSLDGKLHLKNGDLATVKSIGRRKLRWQRNLAFALLSAKFLGLGLWVAPSAVQFLVTGSLAARKRVIAGLGFRHVSQAGAISDSEILRVADGVPVASPKSVTVVLPVYNAFDLLPECLDRIVRHADLPIRMVIVEDCSTDARIKPFLETWIAKQDFNITPLWNSENLGFVGSVNRAFEVALDFDEPVVLINSDAMVPAGWATRMVAPIANDPAVATVTPLSNNAEIFNVPVIVQPAPLSSGIVDPLDAFAALGTAAPMDAPTGVGFCMAINQEFLKQIPAFDTAFGTGYGEEVDWCQKALELGGRNVVQPRLFVEHVGGTSFGSDEKAAKIAANSRIISSRYPTYDADVQTWIASDPMLTTRLRMALKWVDLSATEPVSIYVAHSMGGGAETYLQQQINTRLSNGHPSVVLRIGGLQRWRIEVHTQVGATIGETESTEVMQILLGILRTKHLIYSCGVGDTDPIRLPQIMHQILTPESTLDILVHNFFMVSPGHSLLDRNGLYQGVEAYVGLKQDQRKEVGFDLFAWQEEWRPLMERATRVVAFSDHSASVIKEVYPSSVGKTVVIPHTLPYTPEPINRPSGPRRVVAVLGNLNLEKGAEVIMQLGQLMGQNPSFGLVLLGEVDPRFVLPSAVQRHGQYAQKDLPKLVEKYGITDWIIPSVCPETFSYTTHEALATGMPVWCFDLGAQAEALGAALNGNVLPYGPATEMAQHAFVAFKNPLEPT